MKKILLLVLLISSFQLVNAQDKIYRYNGKIILAKVLEVGAAEVKYKDFANLEGPIYVLETDRIIKIVYENGKVETFKDNLKDPERYAGQKGKAWKVNFFSPLYGYFEAGYEKSLGYGKAYEVTLGIIGAGKSQRLDYYFGQAGSVKRGQFGLFATGGYKFGKLPDFVIFGRSKGSHLMQGTYLKPVLYLGHYKENIIAQKANNLYEVGKQNVTFGALQLELGRQWILGDKLVLDIYGGLGYGFDNKKDSYQYLSSSSYGYYEDLAANNYANLRAGKSPSVSLTGGLRLGLLAK